MKLPCSRCCSNFFTAFRTIGKNLTIIGKGRKQLKKIVCTVLDQFNIFKKLGIKSQNRYRDRPRRDIN